MAQSIYYNNSSNDKLGKINIGLPVFHVITEKAVKEIEGVHIDESQGIFSYGKGAINCEIDDENLNITINVKINYGLIASKVSNQIQEKVANAIFEMTNIKVKTININVIGIEF